MISQRDVPIEDQQTALKTALRSDPDIVFLGECRLQEHFELCLVLAATGHLVLTSLHARDAASACQRIATATGDTGRSALAQTLARGDNTAAHPRCPTAHKPPCRC